MLKKGYTLVELMSVMSMVGIMASIGVPSYQAFQTEAKITKAQAEVKVLQAVVERYHHEHGYWPKDLNITDLNNQINLTDQQIKDPFHTNADFYGIKSGLNNNSKEYYVVYSQGPNNTTDFVIDNDRIYNNGDDILASNLIVMK